MKEINSRFGSIVWCAPYFPYISIFFQSGLQWNIHCCTCMIPIPMAYYSNYYAYPNQIILSGFGVHTPHHTDLLRNSSRAEILIDMKNRKQAYKEMKQLGDAWLLNLDWS